MVKLYVKKPIPVEAVQWDGTNTKELFELSRDIRFIYHENENKEVDTECYVQTLEGNLYAKVGDYIIKGVRGEVYPCACDIFEETYDEVIQVK